MKIPAMVAMIIPTITCDQPKTRSTVFTLHSLL